MKSFYFRNMRKFRIQKSNFLPILLSLINNTITKDHENITITTYEDTKYFKKHCQS